MPRMAEILQATSWENVLKAREEGGKKKNKVFLGLLKHKAYSNEMNNQPLGLYVTHPRMLAGNRAS